MVIKWKWATRRKSLQMFLGRICISSVALCPWSQNLRYSLTARLFFFLFFLSASVSALHQFMIVIDFVTVISSRSCNIELWAKKKTQSWTQQICGPNEAKRSYRGRILFDDCTVSITEIVSSLIYPLNTQRVRLNLLPSPWISMRRTW